MGAPKIVALAHVCFTNDPCAVCGLPCDPQGLDPAIEGTTALVCDQCCRLRAPAVWQAIVAGRRHGEDRAEEIPAHMLDPLPLPAPSAMARELRAENRTHGMDAEWTREELTACNIVLLGEMVIPMPDGEALAAFHDLIESEPVGMTYREAVKIVQARYRQRIEPSTP